MTIDLLRNNSPEASRKQHRFQHKVNITKLISSLTDENAPLMISPDFDTFYEGNGIKYM
jgi:hypothetical protein